MQNSQRKQNLQHLDSQRKKSQRSDSDIDWAKQNKMLADLRWKQRGQPEKTVWWSIQQDIASSHKAGGETNEGE